MNEQDRVPENSTSTPGPDAARESIPAEPFWPRLRMFLLRAGVLFGSLLLFAVVVTAGSGWYTSRPQFCRSCHIMEPYYQSWVESTHKDVSCIECHFEPGVGGKVRGKMLGLVQLATYLTASQGPRPAAEISDASCLRSGCHETRLLSGRVDFNGVPFDHAPHLENLRRDKQLRCTSCHSQIVQGTHMAVTGSTCYLCHFKDQPFNEQLGACTRCHQIPEKEFDLGGGVMFSHNLAYEKGVACVNCHADLIRGNGEVPPDRCRFCHNKPQDLEKINDHKFMHMKHVAEHAIDCMDCHDTIKHSLDSHMLENAAADCASCHPNQHQQQVQMLEGIGAETTRLQEGGMGVIRVACRSCHHVKQVSETGQVVWKASAQMCSACHEATTLEQLQTYQTDLNSSLSQLGAAITAAQTAFETAALDAARTDAVAAELEELDHDLNFLRVGNGIHNVHYANKLIRAMVDRLSPISRELKIEEPQVTLPESVLGGE